MRLITILAHTGVSPDSPVYSLAAWPGCTILRLGHPWPSAVSSSFSPALSYAGIMALVQYGTRAGGKNRLPITITSILYQPSSTPPISFAKRKDREACSSEQPSMLRLEQDQEVAEEAQALYGLQWRERQEARKGISGLSKSG